MHAHFDCFSGISGDMILGAFVDLGISASWLEEQIGTLSIGDIQVTVQDVKKNAIGAKQITVLDHTVSHGRSYGDIAELLAASPFDDSVKKVAGDVFHRIADAEARIHRCPTENVHFHEVGAVDSIVDILGAALCLNELKITSVSSSPLPLGKGFVDCQHGTLPVPAPATLEVLKGIPVYGGTITGERVTPTGAGIIAATAQEFGPIPDMKITNIGYGSGSYDYADVPNVLRVLVGEKRESSTVIGGDRVCVMETHIDDMNPELFGYIMEALFQKGALDVSYSPIMMKKNRPGTKVEVICPPDKQNSIARTLFSESSTIGIRYHLVNRHILARRMSTVNTHFGEIRVKCTIDPDGREQCVPEYEACKKAAIHNQVPIKMVYDAVARAVARKDL